MALLHQATLTPGKRDLMNGWLPSQSWYDGHERKPVGSFRLDDPDGEVGCEYFLLGDDDLTTLFLPLTYRAAPLEGAEDFLIGTTQHSVLGPRWAYDGCGDPVSMSVRLTAILTGGHAATLVLATEDGREVIMDPTCRVTGSGTGTEPVNVDAVTVTDAGDPTLVRAGDHELLVARVLGTGVTGRETLTATWADGAPVVVAAVR
jgi:hypothetical protein